MEFSKRKGRVLPKQRESEQLWGDRTTVPATAPVSLASQVRQCALEGDSSSKVKKHSEDTELGTLTRMYPFFSEPQLPWKEQSVVLPRLRLGETPPNPHPSAASIS